MPVTDARYARTCSAMAFNSHRTGDSKRPVGVCVPRTWLQLPPREMARAAKRSHPRFVPRRTRPRLCPDRGLAPSHRPGAGRLLPLRVGRALQYGGPMTKDDPRLKSDAEACELTIRGTPLGPTSGRSQASAPFSAPSVVRAAELAGLARPQGCAAAQPAARPAGGPVATPSTVRARGTRRAEPPEASAMDTSPGVSNTRARTPAEGSALPRPLLLQASVDALKLAFRVALAETELARMARFLDAGEPAG